MSFSRSDRLLDPNSLRVPDLGIKRAPEQKRSQETYERILRVTAQVLADEGVERLSTNLVCQKAGLAPTALYRYFPNKYALLHELGIRLMNAQNVLVEECLPPEAFTQPAQHLQPAMVKLFMATFDVTRKMPGGVWIMRALRAVPTLQSVRIDSHATVTREVHQALMHLYPDAQSEAVRTMVRMSTELVYAMIEMLFDDSSLQAQAVAESTAWIVHDMYDRVGLIRPEGAPGAAASLATLSA
jgi:AcrR family transcriptional regulator